MNDDFESRIAPRSALHEEFVDRAHAVIPGGTTNSIYPGREHQFIVQRGEGAYLYDIDGRRFLDFLIGAGPLILGHANPRLIEALKTSANRGTHHFELTDRTVELAERLVRYVPSAEAVRFTGSGSEAAFHALRLARAVTGRTKIVKFDGAYHGHHDLAAWNYEDAPVGAHLPHPGSAGIQHGVEADMIVLPYNDAEAVERTLADNGPTVAAVIAEPYQRALTPVPGFLQRVREACDRHGVVLIFDEVVTGFRTAPGGAQERERVLPDLTALGKSLAAGLPLSALVGCRQIMSHLDETSTEADTFSFHCGTYNGYLHAVEAAHTVLDIVVEEEGWKRLQELGAQTRETLQRTYRDAGVTAQVTGGGALFHAYFTDREVLNADDVRASDLGFNRALHGLLREAGIYKSTPKGYVSLAHTDDHIDELGRAVAWAVGKLR